MTERGRGTFAWFEISVAEGTVGVHILGPKGGSHYLPIGPIEAAQELRAMAEWLESLAAPGDDAGDQNKKRESGFPKTRGEMLKKGYSPMPNYGPEPAKCRACSAVVEWWKTPKGKKIPMDAMLNDQSPAVAHWGTCPEASRFRP